MMTNGTAFWFFALAMVCDAAVAMAEGSAPKPASTAPPAKPIPAAKADPFEDAAPAPKPTPAKETIAAPRPTPVAPAKELGAFMTAFEGIWKCDTSFPAGSLGPGSQPPSAKTEVIIRKQFGGYSWHGEFKLAKTSITEATSGVFQIGYAASTKQATFLSYDSVGSAMMGAGALAGDSVTFIEEGFLRGAKVKVRETLAARGPRKMYHKVEIERGNGFQMMAEDICAK